MDNQNQKTSLCELAKQACRSNTPVIATVDGNEIVIMTSSVLEALLYDRMILEAYHKEFC
ncbi:MAG: hypothetical protein VB027_06160 [Gordonibacter sp.]|nr:hypothetical protein [Gordonibacter sp.]